MRVLMQERVSVSGEKVARNHASCFWLGVRDSQSYTMTQESLNTAATSAPLRDRVSRHHCHPPSYGHSQDI